MKNGKRLGDDNITIEMIKLGGVILEQNATLFNRCLNVGHILQNIGMRQKSF